MKETIHFKIQSPANFTRLLATILFEKSEYFEDYSHLWCEVFNSDDVFGDALFEKFLLELFPQGCFLKETELNQVLDRAIHYLQTDEECQRKHIEYLKSKYTSWVYSKWNNKFIPCGFCSHWNTVLECCIEFYSGSDFDEYSIESLRRFLLSNFEIRSANTSVMSIVNDLCFFSRSVSLGVAEKNNDFERLLML